jgi:hypothetical protein
LVKRSKSSANFGQKPFKFPPPAGFQPLALANTPRPSIVRPDQYVGVSTWSGDGTDGRQITVGFKPDFLWTRRRNSTTDHILWDSVRGITKELYSNQNYSEGTTTNKIGELNSIGFTVKNQANANASDGTYVAWCWKAGGNSNTFNIDDVGYASAAAAGLTAGTITPTGASVNTKSGFSIVRFTGPGSAGFQSVPHGLGKTPKFIICKDLDNSRNWGVYHPNAVLDDNDVLILNSTSAVFSSGTNTWDISEINSSIFTPYFRDDFGASYGADNIAYCWAEIPGLSKFGTYTGTSGQNFISLGFEPELVIIKNSSSSSYLTYTGWAMFDSERTPYNVVSNALFANKSQAENLRGNGGSVTVADFSLDLLSNGFCLRDNGASEINLSGNTYIYAAWSKAPSFNLYGAQSNAR